MTDYRGLQGEPGRPGAEGRAGTEGRAGSEGRPGTAGETGTQGRPGVNGAPGAVGQPGATGAPGADGVTGDTGRRGANGFRRLLIMFIFVVLAFSLLSLRLTENTREVARVTRISCERSNANSEQINKFLDILIAFTVKSDLFDAQEKAQRVRGYSSAKVRPLNCR